MTRSVSPRPGEQRMWVAQEHDDRPLSADPVGLVAIDLDGTLLRSDGSICAPSAEAILEATGNGVRVVLATGRAPRKVQPIAKALGLDTLQICHNGALIHDPLKDEPFTHDTMPGQLARQVVEVARRVAPSVAVGVEVLNRCFTDTARQRKQQRRTVSVADRAAAVNEQGPHPEAGLSDTPVGIGSIRASGMDDAVGALAEVLDQPVTKVMMIGSPAVLGGIQMALQEQLSDQVGFAFSELKLLQVVRGDVNKATALAKVAAHYGVSPRGVMAIGDAPNDVEMLRWTGLGVAVGNAWDEVRQAAHFVVSTNNDAGVAEALRRYAR